MSETFDPADVLSYEEVKSFFLSILDSAMTSEEKYNMFVEFFRSRNKIQSQILTRAEQLATANKADVNKIVSEVGKEMGVWDPRLVLNQTADSIQRAVRRLKVSQHNDGGWGPHDQVSDTWGTAFSLMCLTAASHSTDLDLDFEAIISRGVSWLEDHVNDWRVDNLGEQGERPVYNVAIVANALNALERGYRSETRFALDHAINFVAQSQNEDGGWDARLWGSRRWPVRQWSEVGATSNAIWVLALAKRPAFRGQILMGLDWLVQSQNENGSWNQGSCRPELPRFEVTGPAAINKTCDALKGLLASLDLNDPYTKYQPSVARAVDWLRRQEKPLLDENHNIRGWGWVNDESGQPATEYNVFDYENTAMTLEALAQVPDAPLPLLTANAQWLIGTQHQQTGDVEDGNWKMGHTARITLALIKYYQMIQSSPLYAA